MPHHEMPVNKRQIALTAGFVGYASVIKLCQATIILDKAYAMTYYLGIENPLNRRRIMPTLTATEARSNLYRLIDEAASSHEPIIIKGKRGSAVLISEDDWRAIQETMYLLNIPGMRESIREGLATPIEECTRELDW